MELATPSGSRFYFIGRSSTDTVIITDSAYNVTRRLSLPSGASNAAVSGDGRYVAVLLSGSNLVQVISTVTDQVVQQLDGGPTPVDLAFSRDNQRLFVLSAGASRLVAYDMNIFTQVATAQGFGPVGGVTVGPNGLVYVSATNILFEMDPRDLSFRGGAGVSLNAQPGKPFIMPDGFGNARVVMANTNPAFGGSSLATVDMLTRTFTPVFVQGLVFDRILPVSNTRLFALTTGGQLYDITLGGSAVQSTFTGVAAMSNIRAGGAVVSNEFPNSRFLYAAFNGTNQFFRFDIAAAATSGSTFTVANPVGPVSFTNVASTGTVASVYTFNNGQTVQPSAQGLPLILKATDATGRPISGAPVQFSTVSSASIPTQSSVTDGEGFAQATFVAPASGGSFTITATVGTGTQIVVNFNLFAGAGTGGGATGAIKIRSGNGQVVREQSVTPEVLKAVVVDTAGNPVPNAVVNWTVIGLNGSPGSLLNSQSITDTNGEATNTFIAPFLGPAQIVSYVQSKITAATFSGSVDFYVTTVPQVFGNNPVALPNVFLLKPTILAIIGQAGATIAGAIQVRVTAGGGVGVGLPIPNVGISASTGLDPTLGTTARCADNSPLTDSTGTAVCDLVLGPRPGNTPLYISVAQQIFAIGLGVNPGLPGKVTAVQGDNQSGSPGDNLPLALVATVQDDFGNNLPGSSVRWTIDSGSATLLNTFNTADLQARVSTLVRLGSTPGQVRIRVAAQGGATTANYVFTENINITATQIQKTGGDSQTSLINTRFDNALSGRVLDANNQPISGVGVTFQISGAGTLSSSAATSDGNGNFSIQVTAGGTAGTITVSASFTGSNTITWTLTVRPPGPTFTASSITNAAGGQAGIAPGMIAMLRATNIVPNIQGIVLPPLFFGPRPTTLSGVTVSFGGVLAPIFYVSNVSNAESVVVQVPFEVAEGATIPVTVTSGSVSSSVNVTVSRILPGIFEAVDDQNRKYAIVTRVDGSFVTPNDPINRGDRGRAYLTGLGRTQPAASTNSYGASQRPLVNIIVGINDQGVVLNGIEYAPNLIGMFIIDFTVPADTAPGSARNFGVVVDGVAANSSLIAIR